MARRRNRNKRARARPAPQGAPTSSPVAVAVLQERAEKEALNRVLNRNNKIRSYNNRGTSLGYPVNIPGHADMVYRALGTTDEGRLFSLVHLHPCGEYVVNSCGIPDQSQTASVTPTFRGDSVVAMSANYFASPPTLPADFRYDIQLVVLPIPEVDYIFRVRVPSLNTGWSRWVVRRTAYFSRSGDGTSVGLAESGYSGARVVGRGITVHFDAPQLADQGRLIAGQIRAPSASTDVTVALAALTDSNGSQIPVNPVDSASIRRHVIYLPQDETELTNQDPLAAQWEARLGSYIPHRYVQPTQLFTKLSSGRVSTLKSLRVQTGSETVETSYTTTVPKNYFAIVNNNELRYSAETAQPIFNNLTGTGANDPRTWAYTAVGPSASSNLQVSSITELAETGDDQTEYGFWGGSEFINHYTSVQFFLGIQNTAQLHIKTRLHMECEVHAQQSPVTPFAHKSPTYDPVAIQTVTVIAQNQAHVFFASDNDLSGILQSIGAILPGLARSLGNSGVPILSTIGKVVGVVGKGLKDLTQDF